MHIPVNTCCQPLFLSVEQRYLPQEEYATCSYCSHTKVDIRMHTIIRTNLSRAAIDKENRDITSHEQKQMPKRLQHHTVRDLNITCMGTPYEDLNLNSEA